MAAILALQSFNTGLRAALDLPFGALADRVSRRLCLVGASLGILAGAAILLAWPSLAGACVAETCFAMAAALRSGADSALLHDTLRADGRIDLYPRAESRGQAMASLGSGTAAVVGGVLAGIHLALPYVATLATAAAGAGMAWMLEERRPCDHRPEGAAGSARRLGSRGTRPPCAGRSGSWRRRSRSGAARCSRAPPAEARTDAPRGAWRAAAR